MRNFADNVALQIMDSKLRGRSCDAVYELTDAELAVLRDQLECWTVGMSQILADRMGDLDKTQTLIRKTLRLSGAERINLAERAGDSLERGSLPGNADFAAFILVNHSDQLHIEGEIARRQNLH